MRRTLVVVLFGTLATHALGDGSLEINSEAEFDEKVVNSPKLSFVKFLAPWCGHCKKLKPDWDRLGGFYNTKDGLAQIVDVDCTVGTNEKLCQREGVSGYPSLKTYSQSDGVEEYDGEREYNKMKKFVKSKAKPPCDAVSLEHCNKKEKAYLEEIKEWDAAKLSEEHKTLEGEVTAAKKKHEELSAKFEQEKEIAMATMKLSEEAKKSMENITKRSRYKVKLLEQKPEVKKAEL